MSVDFCPNCFTTGFGHTCAACGYVALSQGTNPMLLAPGTKLHGGRYLLGRVLGAGGFGVTYLAKDSRDDSLCAIKEYLPTMLAVRDPQTRTVRASGADTQETFRHGLSVFARESQVLGRFLGNPSIVQVRECFEEYGTAYFAMEYLDGVHLKALARSMGDKVPPDFAMEILTTTAQTLRAVHAQGLLHRDVSPENIFLNKQGQVKLIDFGATRFFVGERSRSLSVILKPGFAPPEQYSSKGNQGPWTDIYALCATVYNILTGLSVPDAPDRLGGKTMLPLRSAVPEVPPALAEAIEAGLALDYRVRPPSIEAFLQMLEGQGGAAPQAAPQAAPPRVQGNPFITVTQGPGAGDTWLLPQNMPMSIGRSSDRCNVVIDAANISRVHCTVQYDSKAGVFYLTDLSSNGTYTSSGRLTQGKPCALQPGEEFDIVRPGCTMKVGLA